MRAASAAAARPDKREERQRVTSDAGKNKNQIRRSKRARRKKKKIERTNDEKMGVTFHGGHTQPPKQQERSETKDGESWLWEHTYVKVEWF